MPQFDLVAGELDCQIKNGREHIHNKNTGEYDIPLLTVEEIEETYGFSRAYHDLKRIFDVI